MTDKSPKAFRTISEAGAELNLPPHVLRFWESKFPDLKPMKRAGGRRFYRPEDIDFLRGAKALLYDEGHSIKSVQKLLRDEGPETLVDLGQSIRVRAGADDDGDKSDVGETEETPAAPDFTTTQEDEPIEITDDDSPIETVVPFYRKQKSVEPLKPVVIEDEGATEDLESDYSEPEVAEMDAGRITTFDDSTRENLADAVERLENLKKRWGAYLK